MRHEVKQLLSLGRLPSEDATVEVITRHEKALDAVTRPLSLEEAEALTQMFGPDTCFGLAWTLLHLIETAPGWEEYARHLSPEDDEWVNLLRDRTVHAADEA